MNNNDIGPVAAFSWPSGAWQQDTPHDDVEEVHCHHGYVAQGASFTFKFGGELITYLHDEARMKESTYALAQFIDDFMHKSGGKKVHIIAHSLGNRGLLNALAHLATQRRADDTTQLGQIIHAHPDVSVTEFGQLTRRSRSLSLNRTVYAADHDCALEASAKFHADQRVGRMTTPRTDCHVVPMQQLEPDTLGHSTYKSSPIITAIRDLIHNDVTRDVAPLNPSDNSPNAGAVHTQIHGDHTDL